MAETTEKRHVAVAGVAPALVAARVHGGGALASGKASTGAAGLGEPPVVVGLARGGGGLQNVATMTG
jgi:hypothetical protein